VVGRDNTVTFDGCAFQIPPQPGRRSCAGLRVTIRRHLTGEYSIWLGAQRLARYAVVLERPRDRRTAVRPVEGDRDRGTPRDVAPPTPPGIRVRTTAVRPVEPSRSLKIGQSKRVEVSTGKRPTQRRRQSHPPRSAIAASRENGILGVDASLPQLSEARCQVASTVSRRRREAVAESICQDVGESLVSRRSRGTPATPARTLSVPSPSGAGSHPALTTN
jgi:hypothetical protein